MDVTEKRRRISCVTTFNDIPHTLIACILTFTELELVYIQPNLPPVAPKDRLEFSIARTNKLFRMGWNELHNKQFGVHVRFVSDLKEFSFLNLSLHKILHCCGLSIISFHSEPKLSGHNSLLTLISMCTKGSKEPCSAIRNMERIYITGGKIDMDDYKLTQLKKVIVDTPLDESSLSQSKSFDPKLKLEFELKGFNKALPVVINCHGRFGLPCASQSVGRPYLPCGKGPGYCEFEHVVSGCKTCAVLGETHTFGLRCYICRSPAHESCVRTYIRGRRIQSCDHLGSPTYTNTCHSLCFSETFNLCRNGDCDTLICAICHPSADECCRSHS